MKPDVLILENLYLSMMSEAKKASVKKTDTPADTKAQTQKEKTFKDLYEEMGLKGEKFVSTEYYQTAVKEFNQMDAVTHRDRFDIDYAKDVVSVGGVSDRKPAGKNVEFNAAKSANTEISKKRSAISIIMADFLKSKGIEPTTGGVLAAFPATGYPDNVDKVFSSPEFFSKASDGNLVRRKSGEKAEYGLLGVLKKQRDSYYKDSLKPKKTISKDDAEKKIAYIDELIFKIGCVIDVFVPQNKVNPEDFLDYDPIIDLITRSYNYCLSLMGASYTNQLFSLKTMTPEKKIALFGKQGPGFGSNVFTFLYIIEKKFGRDFIDHNMEIVKDLLSGGIAKSNFTANNFRDTLNAIGKKYYGVVEDFDNIQVESIKFYDRVGKNILLQLPKMFDNKQFVSDLADKFNSLTGKGDIKFVKKDDSYVAMFDNRRVFTPNSDTGVKIYDILSGLVISSAFNENNRSLEDLCVSLYSESSADGNILGFRKHAKEGYADRVYIYAQKGVKLGLSYSVILENILGDINAGVSKMFSDFNTVKKMKADGKVFFLSRGDDEKVMYKFGGRNGEQAMANVRAEVGESGDDRFVANLDVLIGN